jgi:RND superfamily putative drug exporter
MFALALGGGILIDATIIRGVLARAVVALLGRWNWWLPRPAARILRVEPSEQKPIAEPAGALSPELNRQRPFRRIAEFKGFGRRR